MRQSETDIAAFYDSPLGRAGARLLGERLGALWPDLAGEAVLGLGQARAALEPLASRARRLAMVELHSAAPKAWNARGRGNVALSAEETRLPFADSSFTRVVLLHALEESPAPQALLREVWRVMEAEGRIVVIAANRAGLWSRAEATAFGHGRPYTRAQLHGLLTAALFQPTASAQALYMPPVRLGLVTGAASAWERAGEAFWPGLGGVVMVEALKRLVISPDNGQRRAVRVLRPATREQRLPRDDTAGGTKAIDAGRHRRWNESD